MSGPLGLALAVLLIAANGLFVAAEFALVSVSRPVVEERATAGVRRSRTVSRELGNLSYALSTAQFGITATSLVFGFIAERAVGETLIRPVLVALGLPAEATLSVTLAIAFFVSTVAQMLFGELFPKNLAISRPLEVAHAVTPFTRSFGIVLRPVIRVFDQSARFITERVLRVEMTEELIGGHDLTELARIIAVSGRAGSLSDSQVDLLQRAVRLGDRTVAEIMVPRPRVVWLTGTDSLADLRLLARRTGHSRFPIRDPADDVVVGNVHIKDALGIPIEAHATTAVTAVARETLVVPESASLRRLVTQLRREKCTFAVVVDEYGATAGIVTLEDLLEELVGEIEDEFDRGTRPIRRIGVGRYLVDASVRPDEVAAETGVGLPGGDYGTVAGLVLDVLGRIPEPGDEIRLDTALMVVTRMDGMRVAEIEVTVTPDPGDAAEVSR